MSRRVFDVIDGGIPATFRDGPKQGHVGVVTPDDGMPPTTVRFLDGALVYVRDQRAKVSATDAEGRPHRYRGVVYRMDRDCPLAQEIRATEEQMARERLAQAIEHGEVSPR